MLLAGFAAVEITPPVPCGLGGYGDRSGAAIGVHRPLLARALVLASERARLGLLAADLVAVPVQLCAAVAERAGWAPPNLVVAATHTHSGPTVPPLPGDDPDAQWWETVPLRLAAALARAEQALVPVELALGAAGVNGLGASRHDPLRSGPSSVHVLRLARPDGRLEGMVIHYACHPTVLGADNLYVSPDFPGLALEHLARQCGGWGMFVNGAAGDVSTRFTRRAQDFAEADRAGRLLAEAAGQAAAGATPLPGTELRASAHPIRLPLKAVPPPALAAQRVATARARLGAAQRQGAAPALVRQALTNLQGAELEAGLGQRLPQLEQAVALGVWSVGSSLALVAVPGELFSGTGEIIRRGSPFPHTWILGYANGYAGYFAERWAYDAGIYEALAAHWAPGAGEAVAAAAIDALHAHFREKG